MRYRMRSLPLFAAALIFAAGGLFAAGVAHAQVVSKTAMAGAYSVSLKVLPAESFMGPHAAMAHDAGAAPVTLNGPEHPNHHMVVFVKKDGKPVENATVGIVYRELSPHMGKWITLPVARMHVAGKSLATTHYGNNLKIGPGSYEARVTVNGTSTATFHFMLSH